MLTPMARDAAPWRRILAAMKAAALLALLSIAAAGAGGPAASTGGGAATAAAFNASLLSRQTQEWWRWVLVRIYDSSTFIADGDDAAREAFVEKWRPDLFDWGGDQRWQVREWARLHGIAVAAAGDIEYEEAQFHNHKYVNQTWGVDGGVALNGAGRLAGFASSGLSPFMTHAAPKWHATVTQPHIRHARAHAGEAISEDNCDVMSFGHGGPDMGWGPWEERRFVSSRFGVKLGLGANFSVRQYFHTPPAKPFATDAVVRAFVEFTYLLWRDAWRDIAESSRHAARVAGVPQPAVYGNSANQAISILEAQWQSLKWIEAGWGGPNALVFKLSQAQLRGDGNYTGVWRVAGLRSGQAEKFGARGVRAYLAEAHSNDGNEELLEGLKATGTAFGAGWAHVPECLASAQLASTHRSVFIDRTRIADGAVIYCLACVLWRQTGALAPEPDQHANAVAYVAGTLEAHQVLYEIALLGHPRFFDQPTGLARLKTPSAGGYNWLILPLVDAMSDSDVALIEAYVRGGGRAIIIDGGGQFGTAVHTEDLAVRCNTTGCGLADLQKNPGSGQLTVLNSSALTSWPQIEAAIRSSNSTASVSASGLTASQSLNAWLHGRGPMVSAHVVDFNFSSPLATMPPFQLTVSTRELAAAVNPVARLFSIDFPNETAGRTLPIKRTADGKGWLVSVLPPLPPVTAGMNIMSGHAFGPPSPPPSPTAVDVHAIVVVASSEAELATRAVAAEARMWLQKAVLASSSHGMRLLTTDDAGGPQSSDPMPTLAAADRTLALIQGGAARPFVDGPWSRRLRDNLTLSTQQLQNLMNATRNNVSQNEAAHRRDHLQMCATPSSCLAAVNFVPAASMNMNSTAAAVPGFTSVGAGSLYSAGIGLGFVNEHDTVRDARVGFSTKGPDALHRTGVFNSYRSTFRLDVDLSDLMDDAAEPWLPPRSLLLTVISGFDDLGSPATSSRMGVFGGQKQVPPAGMCSGTPCGGRESKYWMSFATTAVSVAVRPAGSTAASRPAVPCMLGATGRPNGYFLARTCRINVSTAVQQQQLSGGSSKLQLDIVLAPQNSMTGCWTGLCGKLSFAWLLNALVLQRPSVALLPSRARATLAAADAYAAAAVREWTWVGPFDDDHGNGMSDIHEIETEMLRTGVPPSSNATYLSKTGAVVSWRAYKDSSEANAPHLPLSALLPTRALNTGSVAFAMTRSIYCGDAAGCVKRIQVSMSDRGRLWLLSAAGTHAPKEIVTDDLLHGLMAKEQETVLTLPQGWNVFLLKTLSTFAADTIAVNGSRAPGWGVIAPTAGLGLLNGTNEWGVALAVA
jgi:hypothetical protein